MPSYVYETHILPDPLLPFIYHKRFICSRQDALPNWHENIELLYCIGGSGYIKCGMTRHSFDPGDIFVVNADTPHAVCSDGSVVYRCLIVDNSFFEENGLPVSVFHFQDSIRDEQLCQLFHAVVEAYDAYNPDRMGAAADIRYAVLGLLRRLCAAYATVKNQNSSSASSDHGKKALIYIRKNLSVPMSLDEIADHVGISKYHLAREFKAFTGRSVIDTVNLLRCTEAKRLIEDGMQVSAAAGSCGFENLSYFTRAFKKYMGCLPSSLKKITERLRS